MKRVLSLFTDYEISAIKQLLRQNYWWEEPYYSLNILSHNSNETPDTYCYILNVSLLCSRVLMISLLPSFAFNIPVEHFCQAY